MVAQCGMSEKVGKIYVKDQKEEGEEMRAAIDNEVTTVFMQDNPPPPRKFSFVRVLFSVMFGFV